MTDTQVLGRSGACTWGPARGQLPELTFLRYLGFPRKYTRTGHYSSRSPSDRRVTKTAAVRPGTVKEPLDRERRVGEALLRIGRVEEHDDLTVPAVEGPFGVGQHHHDQTRDLVRP